MSFEDEHFGVTKKQIYTALSEQNGIYRDGMLVPSVDDVKTMTIEKLAPLVIGWLWESPTTMIPSEDQVRQLRSVLSTRSNDANDLIKECDDFLGS